MDRTNPESYQLFGDYLSFTWLDGHESFLALEMLRDVCPCANCKGEPDLLGRMLRPTNQPSRTAESTKLVSTEPVGQYGIQLFWGDGHSTGIYTFKYLRLLCDCDRCVKDRNQNK